MLLQGEGIQVERRGSGSSLQVRRCLQRRAVAGGPGAKARVGLSLPYTYIRPCKERRGETSQSLAGSRLYRKYELYLQICLPFLPLLPPLFTYSSFTPLPLLHSWLSAFSLFSSSSFFPFSSFPFSGISLSEPLRLEEELGGREPDKARRKRREKGGGTGNNEYLGGGGAMREIKFCGEGERKGRKKGRE